MKLSRILSTSFTLFAVLWLGQPPLAAQGRGDSRAEASRVPRLVKYVGQTSRSVHANPAEVQPGTPPPQSAAPAPATALATFAVYAEQDGGAALWQETQNVALDGEGRYSVLLGSASRDGMPAELFATGQPRWLGVRVNVAGDAEASIEQARVLLVSVPYALRAADAETLGGRPATDFILRDELAGWSGVAAGVLPGAADAPRAVGGSQGVVNATGAVSFMPRVTAINTPAAGDVTYGDSQIFDDGTNIRIGNAAVGTGLVNIELTTPQARNAFNSVLRLENATPISGTVISAMSLTGADRGTANHESFQVARFTLLKNVISTGIATNFDAVFATTSFINQNAPYTVVGWRAEFPRVATGMTLGTYYGLFLEAPLGGGTVTNAFALVTAPGSGNVGIGTTTPAHLLDVAGDARVTGAIRAGQYLDLAGNPIAGTGTITGVTAGTGLTGGGLTGGVTLAVDSTVALRNAANTFTTDQSIAGNLTLTGAINGGFRVLTTPGAPNLVGGASSNSIVGNVQGGTIAGGDFNVLSGGGGTIGGGSQNTASGGFATVAGGGGNTASGPSATVGGGLFNNASGSRATVAGGEVNSAIGTHATVGGGQSNTASGSYNTVGGGALNNASGFAGATVSGGSNNVASEIGATVPGGDSNTAQGVHSFAAGRRAKANHDGAFVWGDSTDADFASTGANQFRVRANGGAFFVGGVSGDIRSEAANFAKFSLNPSNGFLDEKKWQLYATNGGSLNFSALNDAEDAENIWLRVIRTGGTAIASVQFLAGPVFLGSVPSPPSAAPGNLFIENTSGSNFNSFRLDGFVDVLYISANSAPGATAGTHIRLRTAGAGGGEADRMAIDSTGNVGIGTTTPTERLHVAGNILATGTITPSSRRFKRNILPLTGALGLVERLQGVSYTRRDDGKADIGFIAEDLGAVLPQVVLWETNGTDAKGLDYARLTAVLVEAVKEQQGQLRAQQAQIEQLARQLEQLRSTQQPK